MWRSGRVQWFQFHLLLAGFRIHFIHGSPEPHSTVPDGPFWCVHAPVFEVEQPSRQLWVDSRTSSSIAGNRF